MWQGQAAGRAITPLGPTVTSAAGADGVVPPAAPVDLPALFEQLQWPASALQPVRVRLSAALTLTAPPPPAPPPAAPEPAPAPGAKGGKAAAPAPAAKGGKDAKGAAAAPPASPFAPPALPVQLEAIATAVDSAFTAGYTGPQGVALLKAVQGAYKFGKATMSVGELLTAVGADSSAAATSAAAVPELAYADVRDLVFGSFHLDDGAQVSFELPAKPAAAPAADGGAPAPAPAADASAAAAAAAPAAEGPLVASAPAGSLDGLCAGLLAAFGTAFATASRFESWLYAPGVRVASLPTVAPASLHALAAGSAASDDIADRVASAAADAYLRMLAPLPLSSVGVPTVLYAAVEAVATAAVQQALPFHIEDDALIAVPTFAAAPGSVTVWDDVKCTGSGPGGEIAGSAVVGGGLAAAAYGGDPRAEDKKNNTSIVNNDDGTDIVYPAILPPGAAPSSATRLPHCHLARSGRLMPFASLLQRYSSDVASAMEWYAHEASGAGTAAPATDACYFRAMRAAAAVGSTASALRLGSPAHSISSSGSNNPQSTMPLLVADRIVMSSLWPIVSPLEEWKARATASSSSSSSSSGGESKEEEKKEGDDTSSADSGASAIPGSGNNLASRGVELAELCEVSRFPREVLMRTLALRSVEALLLAADTTATAAFTRAFERRQMGSVECMELHRWSLHDWRWHAVHDRTSILYALLAALVEAGAGAGCVAGSGAVALHAGLDPTSGAAVLAFHVTTPRRRVLLSRPASDLPSLMRPAAFRLPIAAWLALQGNSSSSSATAAATAASGKGAAGKVNKKGSDVEKHKQQDVFMIDAQSPPPIASSATTSSSGADAAAAAPAVYTLYPADHAIVTVASSAGAATTVAPQISVAKDGHLLLLRPSVPAPAGTGSGSASLAGAAPASSSTDTAGVVFAVDFAGDGTTGALAGAGTARVTVSMQQSAVAAAATGAAQPPSGPAAKRRMRDQVVLSLTTAEGLQVEVSSDGWSRQRYVREAGTFTAAAEEGGLAAPPTGITTALPDGAAQSVSELLYRAPYISGVSHGGSHHNQFGSSAHGSTAGSSAASTTGGSHHGGSRRASWAGGRRMSSSSGMGSGSGGGNSAASSPVPGEGSSGTGATGTSSPAPTPDPFTPQHFPAWPAWLPEECRTHIGSKGTVVRHLRFGVSHILRADGGASWFLPAPVAQQVLAAAMEAAAALSAPAAAQARSGTYTKAGPNLPLRSSGLLEEKKGESEEEAAASAAAAAMDPAEAARAAWIATITSAWFLTTAHGQRSVRISTSGSDGVTVLPLPPVPTHSCYDTVTGATVTVRYDQCPVPDPAFYPPGAPSHKAAPMYKKARDILRAREAQQRVNGAHEAERRALLGGLWAGLETDEASHSPIWDGHGTGPQLGRTAVAVFPVTYSRAASLVIHADGTHIAADAKRGRITVAARGFATRDIDAVFDAAAFGHTRGQPVTAAGASGPRTRSVLTTPDGCFIACDYDAGVTARIPARVRLHRPDGISIIATSDGAVLYRPVGIGVQSIVGGTPATTGADGGGGGGGSPRKDGHHTHRSLSHSPRRRRGNDTHRSSDGDGSHGTRPATTAADVPASSLLSGHPHRDVLDAALATDTGFGLAPDCPEGAYMFYLKPCPAPSYLLMGSGEKNGADGKAPLLLLRTSDPEHNTFGVTALPPAPGAKGKAAAAVRVGKPIIALAGCTLPSTAVATLVPSDDPTAPLLLTANIPGQTVDTAAASSSVVLPQVHSPRPPRVFLLQRDGAGLELLSPAAWSHMMALAACGPLMTPAPQPVATGSVHSNSSSLVMPASPSAVAPPPSPSRDGSGSGSGTQMAQLQPMQQEPPADICQVFTLTLPTADAVSLLPKLLDVTGSAVPWLAADASGCGLVRISGRDEVRTCDAAWIIPKAPRRRKHTIEQVFGATAKGSPIRTARLARIAAAEEEAAAAAQAEAMAARTLTRADGTSPPRDRTGLLGRGRASSDSDVLSATGRGGTPASEALDGGGPSVSTQRSLVISAAVPTTRGRVSDMPTIVDATAGPGGKGDGGDSSPSGSTVLWANSWASSDSEDELGSTTSSSSGGHGGSAVPSLVLRAWRKRCTPRAFVTVPQLLTPPWELILRTADNVRPHPAIVAAAGGTAAPVQLPSPFTLWRTVTQVYQLSPAERGVLKAEEAAWASHHLALTQHAGAFTVEETRTKAEIQAEADVAVRIIQVRKNTGQGTTRRRSLLLASLQRAGAVSAALHGVLSDASAATAAERELVAAAKAAEAAAARAVAAAELAELTSSRGAYKPQGTKQQEAHSQPGAAVELRAADGTVVRVRAPRREEVDAAIGGGGSSSPRSSTAATTTSSSRQQQEADGGMAALERDEAADGLGGNGGSTVSAGTSATTAQMSPEEAAALEAEVAARIAKRIDVRTGKPFDAAAQQRMRIAEVRQREKEASRRRAAELEARRQAARRGITTTSTSAAAAAPVAAPAVPPAASSFADGDSTFDAPVVPSLPAAASGSGGRSSTRAVAPVAPDAPAAAEGAGNDTTGTTAEAPSLITASESMLLDATVVTLPPGEQSHVAAAAAAPSQTRPRAGTGGTGGGGGGGALSDLPRFSGPRARTPGDVLEAVISDAAPGAMLSALMNAGGPGGEGADGHGGVGYTAEGGMMRQVQPQTLPVGAGLFAAKRMSGTASGKGALADIAESFQATFGHGGAGAGGGGALSGLAQPRTYALPSGAGSTDAAIVSSEGALSSLGYPPRSNAATAATADASVPLPIPAAAQPGGPLVSLQPSAARFGVVHAGHVYRLDIYLLHSGAGMLRFRVDRQHEGGPRTAAAAAAAVQGGLGTTGAAAINSVKVYHEAGPLARGMTRLLEVELVARQAGMLSEVVQIITPVETLNLPVSARILPPAGYAQGAQGVQVEEEVRPGAGVRVIA